MKSEPGIDGHQYSIMALTAVLANKSDRDALTKE
jgi:hypothetical protein